MWCMVLLTHLWRSKGSSVFHSTKTMTAFDGKKRKYNKKYYILSYDWDSLADEIHC